jgi:MFS transporter, putative metabolite:H+ symporter
MTATTAAPKATPVGANPIGMSSSDAIPVGGIPVGERLDRLSLTPLHVAVIALCTAGLAVDIGEVALSNTFSAIFLSPPYNAPRDSISLLLGAVFAGGAIGAPMFGWYADRCGRRAALQLALFVLVVSSLAVAFSPSIGWMTLFRFVSGLALGGYPPLTAAYLADLLPPQRRGTNMMLCAAFAFLGAPALIFLIRWLTPVAPLGIEGWRWALIAATVFSAVTAALFFAVPESPRWLAAVGRNEEAERSFRRFHAAMRQPVELFSSMPARPPRASVRATNDSGKPVRLFRRVIFLAALYGLGPWATIGFPLLSATVMLHKGFRVGDSLLFAGLSMLGPTIGITILAFLLDRIERRIALVLCAAILVVLGLGFDLGTTLTPLVLLGFGFNLASAAYSTLLSIYGAELFPTDRRALATSAPWGLGRMVSAFVPLALLPLLSTQGPLAMFGVIIAVLLVSILLIAIAGPPGLARTPVE